MKKEEVLQVVSDKKSAAGQPFDEIANAVASIEVDGGSEIADLQKQIEDLKAGAVDLSAQLQAKSDELEALKAKEASEAVQLIQDAMDLDNLKTQLQDAMAKIAKDEDALKKFKAILAELSV